MCGIAGFHLSNGQGNVDSRELAESLLKSIVVRGRDATGVAWLKKNEENTEVWYSKQAVDANRFIANQGVKHVPKKCRTAIVHTRYATQGDKSNSHNNHPIVVDGIVGVHNGHISNDKQLVEKGGFPRIGQVDSEAAFWQLSKSKSFIDGLEKIEGTAALAWLEVDKPKCLHLARCAGSPLVVAQNILGSVFFASTKPLLEKGLKSIDVGKLEFFEIPEWTYLRVQNGRICDWIDIPHVATKDVYENWYSQPNLPWSPSKYQATLEDPWEAEQAAMRQFGWK